MENTRKYGVYIAAGAAVLAATKLYLYIRKIKQGYTERVCGVDYPTDVVILHQVGRERTVPSLGHFVLKLETYLRYNKIPFQSEFTPGNFSTGPKKKVPWIEYNGVTMGDSQMIIEFLNKKLNVDMDCHLTKLQKAQAWAIQKWLEEFMYCDGVYVPKYHDLRGGVRHNTANATAKDDVHVDQPRADDCVQFWQIFGYYVYQRW